MFPQFDNLICLSELVLFKVKFLICCKFRSNINTNSNRTVLFNTFMTYNTL